MYSKCHIVSPEGTMEEIVTFGPVSILPSQQKRGCGTRLIQHSIAEATRLGYKAIAIYGAPEYYGRFGFKKATDHGIFGEVPEQSEALQILELQPSALESLTGVVRLPSVFEVDPQKVEEFDTTFSPKKREMPHTPL